MKYLLIILFFSSVIHAQNQIDVKHYYIQLEVNDSNDVIQVIEDITISFLDNCKKFELDLISKSVDDKGMVVESVAEIFAPIEFLHANDKLTILPKNGKKGFEATYRIKFSGIPKDGLIISENKFGNRTFFGDNWPNRARNWFACVDHPSDKAKSMFSVTAPSHYSCISNGSLIAFDTLSETTIKTTYKSDIELPTKVLVVGIADFKINKIKDYSNISHTIWTFPEDEKNGVIDMQVAADPLAFYSSHIAPYPYEKLANVQSTTRFGGMENASCIFYDENAVTGKKKMENLIAHEIAHQWFGNSASESDWPHLWLSEGFATYFTNLYLESKYGRDKMNEQLIKDRERVIKFNANSHLPIVDTISTDLMFLLNPNSYQKGSWFLHMLRDKISEKTFWECVVTYYKKYAFGNASTADFKEIVEGISNQELDAFFHQWLHSPGIPKINYTIEAKKKSASITIIQTQEEPAFNFPLTVKFNYSDGTEDLQVMEISKKQESFTFKTESKLISIDLDPMVNLLYEEVKNK